MKYFLIEITTKADKIEKGIYEYDDQVTAIANFHSKMGGAMKNTDYLAETLLVIDENGATLCSECFTRPTDVEPEEA